MRYINQARIGPRSSLAPRIKIKPVSDGVIFSLFSWLFLETVTLSIKRKENYRVCEEMISLFVS